MAFDESTREVITGVNPEIPFGHIAMGGNADKIDIAQKPAVVSENVRMAAKLHASALGGQLCVQRILVDNIVGLSTDPRS